jgi:hypothetical protein
MAKMPSYLLYNVLPVIGGGQYWNPEWEPLGEMPIGPIPSHAVRAVGAAVGKYDRQRTIADIATAFLPGGAQGRILLRTYWPEYYDMVYGRKSKKKKKLPKQRR